MALVWLLLATTLAGSGSAQQGSAERIDVGELAQDEYFDFLEGNWRYRFEGGDGTASYSLLDPGPGIREVVDGQVGSRPFTGTSLIYLDRATAVWRQRWIDTLGSVLEGTIERVTYGEAQDAALQATFEPLDGVIFRHVWFQISTERFDTDLLVSRDGGETFRVVRRAPYVRQ